MTADLTDRLPPQNLAAEASTLGAMLLDNVTVPLVASILDAEAFYSPDHRVVYEAILALTDEGKPADALTVSDRLDAMGDLERVGGRMFLAQLLADTPSTANAEYYAHMVHDAAVRRRLIRAGNEIVRMGYDATEDVPAAVDGAQALLLEVDAVAKGTEDTSVAAVLSDVMAAIQAGEPAVNCLPTGFSRIDEMIIGLPAGAFVVLGGRPSHGKSALAMCIALKACIPAFRRPVGEPAFGVIYFSVEDTKRTFCLRALACLSQCNSYAIRKGSVGGTEARERVRRAAKALTAAPLLVDDTPAITVEALARRARRIALRDGPPSLIVVDYLQLVETSRDFRSRTNEVTHISRRLKALAGELDCPLLACCQLNREVEARTDHTPRLSDLRESGSIEQDADLVLLVNRPERYIEGNQPVERPGEADVLIAKNRDGPTGRAVLGFQSTCTRFEDFYDGI